MVGHELATALRATLVHGLAALALAVVAVSVGRAAGRAATVAGLTAAALSVAQWVMELALAGPVAGARDAATAHALVDAVNRVDGLKMLALAALALTGARALPARWLKPTSVALAGSLLASAAGYGLLLPALAPAAFVSLPLLLVWVAAAGLARAGR